VVFRFLFFFCFCLVVCLFACLVVCLCLWKILLVCSGFSFFVFRFFFFSLFRLFVCLFWFGLGFFLFVGINKLGQYTVSPWCRGDSYSNRGISFTCDILFILYFVFISISLSDSFPFPFWFPSHSLGCL
jgi:hypothetical protein